MHYAKGFLEPDLLDEAVNAMIPLLGPDVERLRYSLEEDWSGDPAIYFKIVLSDDSSSDDRLRPTTKQIEDAISRHLQPLSQWGLFCYTTYRTHSELAARQEKAWA